MIYDPKNLTFQQTHKLMIGSIIPRPIAFVATTSLKKSNNIAPFSYFNGVCSNPPTIMFAPARRGWDGKEKDTLTVNKFGVPEPFETKKKGHLPDIILVPLVAFDSYKNRLGYGKGFYDRYLYKLIKLNKKIETIGVAFSFQKYKKLPTSNFDFKLNNIYTEKGFVK